MSYSDWKEINVNVAQVLLDYDNPRVFIDKPTQENLLRFLVNEEDSIELANSINTNQGLPPAEKPVVILEDGKYVVVEGNRRISACKLLYNRSLLSTNEFNKVPDIDSSMKEYLENLPVVLAPSRDAAEPFITSRHAGEKGIKRWSTIATTKRYINRYRKQESINHIARVLGETPSIVRKGIRFFYFLEYVRNELSWTDEEKRNLEIFKMETTKLDRFLPFSKKAREILKIDFLPNQRITTELPVQNFNAALKDIIERIYLHNEIDTRSTVEEVFDSRVVSMSQRDLNTAKTDMG
ncbi:ParB/Srx family N-terminal domain-containing protein, partial [Paenibacillus polymyxa]|uniref:ParB/Srx family N-terminal domain-containing protein n=2 Tax=Paenibacillus polymyxa TaxID=1406 RepID=UPI0005ED12C1